MATLLMVLGGAACIASSVCAIIVLIDAFSNEVWKGILGLFCGLYLLIYAFTEYQGNNKGLILAGWLLGGVVGFILFTVAGTMGASGMSPVR
jgi:hypothetical protein